VRVCSKEGIDMGLWAFSLPAACDLGKTNYCL